MDKLKNFIDTNREAFEDDLLPEGHFDRFEKKLPKTGKKHFKLYSLVAFAAAASIALLFLFRMPGGTPVPETRKASVQKACSNQEEINELQIYYKMQIGEIMAQMESLYKKEQTPGGAELLQESKKILKDNYMFEETILPTLPCSNDGLFAMNQHYSASVESLNIMLKQMEIVVNDNEIK
ncbi:LPXTG cell wall anchor domain-containing protein [Parabacteroides sp.]